MWRVLYYCAVFSFLVMLYTHMEAFAANIAL